MAVISVNVVTNDVRNEQLNRGHYEVKILAGLDEDPDTIFQEGLERVKNAISGIPPEKRYPRLRFGEAIRGEK